MEATPNTRENREIKNDLPDNEIRVSFKTDVQGAVERIEKAFEKFDHVKLSGINSGISKLIVILEITKVKLENLHQINMVETLTGTSTDGSDRPRFSTAYRAELHKSKPATPAGYFYQAPYSKDHIEAVKAVKVNTPTEDGDRPRGEFRGRGRGMRGGRGRGGFRGGRGGEAGRGGFVQRGGEGEFRGGRGGFRGNRGDGEGRGRGGFRGTRGDGEGRGGFRGTRGDGEFRGGRGAPRGGRGGSRGGRGGDAPQDRPQTAQPGSRGIPGLGGKK